MKIKLKLWFIIACMCLISGYSSQADKLEEQPNETTQTTSAFDLEKSVVKLNSGYEMPIIGIGTFRLSDSECENSV